MKKLIPILLTLLLVACTTTPTGTGEALTGYSKTILILHGMSCPLCSNNVDGRLSKVPGIETVNINLETGKVTATFSANQPPTREQIERAIKEAGFTLKDMELFP